MRHTSAGHVVLSDMGITDTRLRVAYCLMVDHRPWNISAIHNATGLTRVTVRTDLNHQVEKGWAKKSKGGYQITEAGMKRFRDRYDIFFEGLKKPLVSFHRLLMKEYPNLAGV